MATAPQETLFEKLKKRAQNNPYIVGVLVLVAVIGGVGALIGSYGTIRDFLFGNPELRKEYCELLSPLVVQLDRTKNAIDKWNQKDLSIESETIRDGNIKARTLLSEKAHLVPSSLREDQKKFILHYDNWLEEYDRVRVRRTKDPDAPFVYTYDYPSESEKRFRDRKAKLEAILGDSPCK
jgi:hypothetical protein